MRRLFVGMTALTVVLGSFAHAQAPSEAAFDARVAAILAHWEAPGAVITIVRHGDVILQEGYGTTRVGGTTLVTPRTLVSVASVTKTVTSVAMGMLVDDGAIGWNDPVRRHIPEFRFVDDYRSENTTLRDLLTHRAGLPPVVLLAFDLESGEVHPLGPAGALPQFLPPGYLLYWAPDSTVVAAPFDPDRAEITGDGVPLLSGVYDFDVAADGTLFY